MNLPSQATLKRYGLTILEWSQLYERQEHRCPICQRIFDEKVRPCIDHQHVPHWKKMKPEQRKKFVRGLLCLWCNQRMLPKGMTRQRAMNLVAYLEKFECRSDTVSVGRDDLKVQVDSNHECHHRQNERGQKARQHLISQPVHEG